MQLGEGDLLMPQGVGSILALDRGSLKSSLVTWTHIKKGFGPDPWGESWYQTLRNMCDPGQILEPKSPVSLSEKWKKIAVVKTY